MFRPKLTCLYLGRKDAGKQVLGHFYFIPAALAVPKVGGGWNVLFPMQDIYRRGKERERQTIFEDYHLSHPDERKVGRDR